jgi:hypothetical protein
MTTSPQTSATLLQKVGPHLLVLLAFLVISFAYFSPVLQQKGLYQHDVKMAEGMAKANKDYHKKNKTLALWTPTMFAGMPAYMIYMDYPASFSTHIGRALVNTLPEPVNLLFLYLLGAYIGLVLLGCGPGVAALGAVAYAFSAYNIINIGAGHISKTIAVATTPPFVAAVLLTFQGRYWWGGALTAFFAAVHQYSNFIQMSYYLVLALLIITVMELVRSIREKQVKRWLQAVGILAVGGILSVATHTSRYWVNYEYAAETIRGKSELSDSPANLLGNKSEEAQAKPPKEGLDKGYAFQWSYGKAESLNFLIPNLMGGGSSTGFSEDSEVLRVVSRASGQFQMSAQDFYYALAGNGLIPGAYWGDQPGTGGPAYMGALLLFLTVFCFLISKNYLKWWALGTALLFMMLAWGSNWAWFNYFLFDYFPLFNKFRAVTMVLSILPLAWIVIVGLGLQELSLWARQEAAAKAASQKLLLRHLRNAAIGLGGLVLMMALLGGFFFDFSNDYDQQIAAALQQATGSEQLANELLYAAQQDRADLMRADAWRSFFFIALGALALWILLLGRVSWAVFVWLTATLVLADLWLVDKRYLNNEQFVRKSQAAIKKTAADEQILRDTTYYRVLNLTVSPFNDATTSYYHHSVGGYHAAKLRRYQDLIEGHISRNNTEVLHMLNTKYIVVNDREGKGAQVQENPQALGAAWLVPDWRLVSNADEELKALQNFEAAKIAIVHEQFKEQLAGLSPQNNAEDRIVLLQRSPDMMRYETQSASPRLAVFSEIYYDKGWQAYIDGQAVPHLRANYVLRALVVPAGKHQVEFRFEPKAYYQGEKITLAASVLWLLWIGLGLFVHFRKK